MRTISHEQAREQLQPDVRARLDAAGRAALEAHLERCPECRAAAAEVAALDRRLARALQARWAGARPAADARATVRARLQAGSAPRGLAAFARAAAGLLAIAAILGLVGWLAPRMAFPPVGPAVGPTPAAGSATPAGEPATPVAATPPGASASPALGRIAYVQAGDIWVKPLPEGEPVRLTGDGRNLAPRWSSSGDWLTFEKDGNTLWLMRADGSGARELAPLETLGSYAWSPVEDRLAFVAGASAICMPAPDELADESRLREDCTSNGVWPPPREPYVQRNSGLAWRPDGRELAFVREWGLADSSQPPWEHVGIFTLAADLLRMTGRDDVAAPQDGIMLAGWAPGGDALLYWSIAGRSASLLADGVPLMQLALDGQPPTVLASQMLAYPDYLASSATPAQLALIAGGGRETWSNKQLVWLPLGTGQAVTLTATTQAAASPAFSPDGTQLAYVAMPAARPWPGADEVQAALVGQTALMGRRIQITDLTAPQPARVLVDDPAYRDEQPQWSADGSWILFARFDAAGRASLWLAPSAGGQPRQVVAELSGSAGGQPVPDPLAFYGHVDWDRMFAWWRGSH